MRQRDAVLEKQMLLSLSGQQWGPFRLCLSLTACCVFPVDSICGSTEHAHLEGKSVGAAH